MKNSKRDDNCIYNLLYVSFNEDTDRENNFYYNLQYPSFYNFSNTYFYIDSNILKNINSTIKSDTFTFKNGLFEAYKQGPQDTPYKVISTYAVTFSKNHILSTILTLMGFIGNTEPTYNQIDNYNFDLLTGNQIYLKDIFRDGIDYIKVVTDYVNYKINQNKDLYYEDVFIDIPDDQAFYLTDDGIVIYFELDEIAPAEFGIPKFKISFDKFSPYINPRFYCTAQNVDFLNQKKHKK